MITICRGEAPAVGEVLIVVSRVNADGTIRNVAWLMPADGLEELTTEEGRVRHLLPAFERLKL